LPLVQGVEHHCQTVPRRRQDARAAR
jgi:hypothetical protein